MPETHRSVLLIEDEVQMQRFLRTSLQAHGFSTQLAGTIREALILMTTTPPDIALLDLGLPDGHGVAFIQQVRGWSNIPIIVLSAQGTEADKVQALDAGADDYLTKPFSVNELLARMRVSFRRAHESKDDLDVVNIGHVTLDRSKREVRVHDQSVHLTPIEFKLLCLLSENAGRVVTHAQILKAVWGPAYAHQNAYVRVFITQLRHKLEIDPRRPTLIVSESGVGYRLTDIDR